MFDNEDTYMTMFNSEIIKKLKQHDTKECGPSLLGSPRNRKRYQTIKVQWQTAEFKSHIKTFTGRTAQIIQYEIDNCNGVLIKLGYECKQNQYYEGWSNMNVNEIFQNMIGSELEGLVVKYTPYNENFDVHPYRQSITTDFEQQFADLLFDSIIFYAFEKEEIEKDYIKGRLKELRKASRAAYEMRVPKTEKECDGLFGELALDSFLKCFFPNMEMLYSRVKYLERYPRKGADDKRSGHEVRGYDGLLFSCEDDKKYMWVGQVKTGSWKYCLDDIKKDINKSILEHYFSSAMMILADIMKAVSCRSKNLLKIIDDLNDLILEHSVDKPLLHSKIVTYFKEENITIRVPCLIIADEENYSDEKTLLEIIKTKVKDSFDDFNIANDTGLNIEVLLLVFPVQNIGKIRSEFLGVRKQV